MIFDYSHSEYRGHGDEITEPITICSYGLIPEIKRFEFKECKAIRGNTLADKAEAVN